MRESIANVFTHTALPLGDDGKKGRGIIARCGSCDAAIPLHVNTMPTRNGKDDEIEWQFIAKKLEAKGWRIARNRNSHRCPQCLNALKFNATHKKEPEVPHINGAAITPAQEARTMTREDRRIIFAKLQEVYVDSKTGYGNGWTDEKVASDLGVPRAWVRVIRDENFGDEVSNEDIRFKIKQAQQILATIREAEPEMRRLFGLADKIEKELTEIQKVLK